MPEAYDLAVIGAGPGGYVAAIRAAQLGLRTVLIEKDAVGGLCLNWGCIPSKALLHAADLLNLFRRGPEFGITAGEVNADLGVAVDRSREVVTKFVAGVETLLQQNGVTLIRGTGRLEGAGRVRVEPPREVLEAANVIVATGGVARSIPGLVPDGDRILTSREALALREPPRSIVIAGGGAIGVEFGYLYRSYGAQVTIVEVLPHLLPGEDEEISRQLERTFTASGINVLTGTAVETAEVTAAGVAVSVRRGGETQRLEAERVLVGAGFGPNSDSLGLAEAGVELGRGWVKVDEYCRTSVPGIWAIGDVTGKLLLAHVASHQGVTAVEKIAGLEPQPLDYEKMPRAVYCQPQVGALGLTEAQARERGHDVVTGRFPFRASGKALAIGESDGFVKLVVDRESRAVLGYHIIGHGATELLGEASLGAVLETTPEELGLAVHAHPTLSEALMEAALAADGRALHVYRARA
jgi:dihydrolipoamide dehydrogenase